MIKVLQINTVCNRGSTGRIAEELGLLVIKNNWESHIAYGRGDCDSSSNIFKIGTRFTLVRNALISRLFDSEGFEAKQSTRRFVKYIERLKPDIIHMHNLHGYYLNLPILFEYLKSINVRIVWTLHDCWSFTGHCAYFDYVGCDKWMSHCSRCPQIGEYPKSIYIDNSRRNFGFKKELITGFKNLTIVTPSLWLSRLVRMSYLKNYQLKVINNGIDVIKFKPNIDINLFSRFNFQGKKVILGVASEWTKRKGLKYFMELSLIFKDQIQIIIIGLNGAQILSLPNNIIGLKKTSNLDELVGFYSLADVFVNPTLEDNFPTTNLEALACGTPVVCFDSGGSSESISSDTGFVVPRGDLEKLEIAIHKILFNGKKYYSDACRKRALEMYDSTKKFNEYFSLYNEIVIKS
jgi:putative colanic acid biosynthesis glycosyltransferase